MSSPDPKKLAQGLRRLADSLGFTGPMLGDEGLLRDAANALEHQVISDPTSSETWRKSVTNTRTTVTWEGVETIVSLGSGVTLVSDRNEIGSEEFTLLVSVNALLWRALRQHAGGLTLHNLLLNAIEKAILGEKERHSAV